MFDQPSSRPFAAKYPGICAECGGEFEEGEQVAYYFGKIAHALPQDCTTSTRRPEKAPCSSCFLVHAGDCF